jgi:hypothetical protein
MIINRQIATINKFIPVTDMNYTKESLKSLIEKYDTKFILIGYSSEFINNPIPDLGVPIILNIGDPARRLQGDGVNFPKVFKSMNITGIVTHSNCSIEPIQDCLGIDRKNIFLHILGVDLDFVKDYELMKDIDVSHTGKFSHYQFRRELHDFFSIQDKFNYQRIRNVHDNINPLDLYTNYLKVINRSFISIGHCTQDKEICYYKGKFISDVAQKNFEVMGSRSCLLTSNAPDMEFHGMKDGVNCILFNSIRDAYRKVLFYLDDKELLKQITYKGYELVRKNHNINNNVYNLLKELNDRYA